MAPRTMNLLIEGWWNHWNYPMQVTCTVDGDWREKRSGVREFGNGWYVHGVEDGKLVLRNRSHSEARERWGRSSGPT